ncbi:hypothetical protein BDZ97DRAFT_1925749 [Flammula alnicola]|nr:hypothetical protein BDZ97DRAFT_1925749 [Flammula alnicola]
MCDRGGSCCQTSSQTTVETVATHHHHHHQHQPPPPSLVSPLAHASRPSSVHERRRSSHRPRVGSYSRVGDRFNVWSHTPASVSWCIPIASWIVYLPWRRDGPARSMYTSWMISTVFPALGVLKLSRKSFISTFLELLTPIVGECDALVDGDEPCDVQTLEYGVHSSNGSPRGQTIFGSLDMRFPPSAARGAQFSARLMHSRPLARLYEPRIFAYRFLVTIVVFSLP